MARTGTRRHLILFGLAICAGAVAMLGFRANTQGAPTSVAVVDLFRLMNNLDELQQDKAELDAIQNRYQTEIDADVTQIQQLESELSELVLSEEQQFEKKARHLELRATANAKVQRSELILQFEDNRRTIQRYNKLVAAANQLGKEQGFDIVLVRSDRKAFGELPDPEKHPPQQLQDIMLLRQMIYVNDAIDITDQLIARMNNDFKAGANPSP